MTLKDEPWSLPPEEILNRFDVSIKQGLSNDTVKKRLKKYGKNLLQETKRKSTLKILLDQFKSIIMALLAAASIISFIFGEWLQGLAVVIVLMLTTIIGFITELRAVRSMEALKKLSRVKTKVRRNDKVKKISAEYLVPGDIVVLDSGDIVTADIRLLEANKLQSDESPLTGESVPVSKNTEQLPKKTNIADRKNMVFKGTTITRGSGLGVVVYTGKNSELGKISTLVQEAKEEITPLEKRLNKLGRKLVWLTIVLTVIIGLLGIFRGKELFLMVETAIALAVAAIPEGLPIVATIALARGMLRMAKRNALINRLSSVETLGATNVIFTDKTGTLTLNKMTMDSIIFNLEEINIIKENENKWLFKKGKKRIEPKENKNLLETLKVGVLCNNASLSSNEKEDHDIGDPMEIALLEAGDKVGLSRPKLIKKTPEKREEAFDPETKMMATYHKINGEFYVAVKGAPEALIEQCSQVNTEKNRKKFTKKNKENWLEKNEEIAEQGLRTLGFAYKIVDSKNEKPYNNLTFLGLVTLIDPPRSEVKKVIKSCKQAGINIIMVTGDHPATASNIAYKIGLIKDKNPDILLGSSIKSYNKLSDEEKKRILKTKIFARVSPKQKLDLISIHQRNGSIVAMTGDGVNDAPALKKADIGIAMGKRGTQVAKEASDVILQDDSFSTIAVAVEYGRIIFSNIRNFVLFLLSGNVGEILAVGFASLLNYPLPILPLQILYVNLILDVFPALALGVGDGKSGVMSKSPRNPKEPVLTPHHWILIILYGLLISFSILGTLYLSIHHLHLSLEKSVTASFLTLTFARLGHVFNMRDRDAPILKNEITKNKYIWAAIAISLTLILAAIFLPGLSKVLSLINPGIYGWIVVLIMSSIPFIVAQIAKVISNRLKIDIKKINNYYRRYFSLSSENE